jgi:tetratricopeptide (TPR) repeat protein
MKHFSIREAARILDVTEAQVRSYARAGLLDPKGDPGHELELTFQDLVLLRTTKGLRDSGVPARRMRRIWSSLRRQLSDDIPLTSINVYADGDRVVAWDGNARWQPDSGQFVIAFEGGDLAARAETEPAEAMERGRVEGAVTLVENERAVPLTPPEDRSEEHVPGRRSRVSRGGTSVANDPSPPLTAEQWFRLASELEESSPLEARRAYQEAIALDPDHGDAHLNLGRHYHEIGELGKAEAHYRDTVRCDPDDPTAHFNLGVLLEDRERPEDAVHAYRQALARDPDMADAHYNLGLLLETLGRRAEAVRHLMEARRLYGEPDPEV